MAAKRVTHTCADCNAEFPHGFTPRCPHCSGMVETTYDLSRARIRDSDRMLERYFDFLPIADSEHLLSVGEGGTECRQAGTLGDRFGLERLFVKIESTNPTGTTKDRMAAVVVSLFHELGIHDFVSSSTGNSSNALAHAIGCHPYFHMHLFLGDTFCDRFTRPNAAMSVNTVPGLDFVAVFSQARAFAKARGLPFEAGFFNPARREGLKTAYFEAVDQVPHMIDWYVQAASSAMGVHGTAKGARELLAIKRIAKIPRMVCVQQDSCAPIVTAYREDSPVIAPHHVVHNPTGIAAAILRGDPSGCYPYVYRMLKATDGLALSVTEAEILEAQAMLHELEGIACCTNAATTVAATRKLARAGTLARRDTILLNLTG